MDVPRSMTLPTLGDSNFEAWRQSLNLVAGAISAETHLVKDLDPSTLARDEKKNFFLLANAMLSSLSERPRAIAIGAGTPADIVPFRMFDRLKQFYTPVSSFNDLSFRRDFFQLKYKSFGAIDLLAAAIQRIASKINEIEVAKAAKYKCTASPMSERDRIAVLVATLPAEYDPEIKEIKKHHDWKFEQVVEELRSREIKIHSKGESASPDSLNSIEMHCTHCNGRGHTVDRCWQFVRDRNCTLLTDFVPSFARFFVRSLALFSRKHEEILLFLAFFFMIMKES